MRCHLRVNPKCMRHKTYSRGFFSLTSSTRINGRSVLCHCVCVITDSWLHKIQYIYMILYTSQMSTNPAQHARMWFSFLPEPKPGDWWCKWKKQNNVTKSISVTAELLRVFKLKSDKVRFSIRPPTLHRAKLYLAFNSCAPCVCVSGTQIC